MIRQSDDESTIIFECKLVGDPRPEIAWFHNESKIRSGSKRHRMRMGEAENKLFYMCHMEIQNVDSHDAGIYKAVARNALGEGHATINLAFEEGKEFKNYRRLYICVCSI